MADIYDDTYGDLYGETTGTLGYGDGGYGEGPYGEGDFVTTDRVLMPAPPQHLLGVGPWATGVTWKADPNRGLVPTVTHPSYPLVGIPNPTSVSFTLRRDKPSEASVSFTTDRGSALLVDEMITDLWYRRYDPTTDVSENIGRFQASSVTVSRRGDRIDSNTSWVDYRDVINNRMIFDNWLWDAGSPVIDAVANVMPTNAGVTLTALTGANLGVLSDAVQIDFGATVGDALVAIQAASPLWDWDVELIDNERVLTLYPGGRGTNRGVVLADTGAGYTPLASWDRATNSEDYANVVYLAGADGGGQVAALDDPNLPMGVRETQASNSELVSAANIAAAARVELAKRSQRRASWTLTLTPGFWQGRAHIDIGDTVRVFIRLGDLIVDESDRVEEITVETDANGSETVTLTVGWPRPSRNPRSKQSAVGRILAKIRTFARMVR